MQINKHIDMGGLIMTKGDFRTVKENVLTRPFTLGDETHWEVFRIDDSVSLKMKQMDVWL